MSKRQIESALRKKGLACKELFYNRQIPVPEEILSAWEIYLDDESLEKLEKKSLELCEEYEMFPDSELDNTEEVLEWVETLPDCRK